MGVSVKNFTAISMTPKNHYIRICLDRPRPSSSREYTTQPRVMPSQFDDRATQISKLPNQASNNKYSGYDGAIRWRAGPQK